MKAYGLIRRCNEVDVQYHEQGSIMYPRELLNQLESLDTKTWQVIRLDIDIMPEVAEMQEKLKNAYKKIDQLEVANEELRKVTCTRCK